MKREISPVVIVVALVVLIAVLGFIGMRATGPSSVQGMDKAEFKRRMGQYQNSTSLGKPTGGGPLSSYPGGQNGKPVPPQ